MKREFDISQSCNLEIHLQEKIDRARYFGKVYKNFGQIYDSLVSVKTEEAVDREYCINHKNYNKDEL